MADSITIVRKKAELRAELWRDYRVSIPRPLIERMDYIELKAIRNIFRQVRAAPDAYEARVQQERNERANGTT